ncbi:hypothetical protein AB0E62_28160 [Streptomyces sp. NPDC038707]|uniref:hypothetical protein n=1 Tax=Streptomyces sp. NPDC038707 TaxID=3154329 RepID=UPI0033F70FB0
MMNERGEMRMLRPLPDGGHHVTLTGRHGTAEAQITSRTLDEPALRHLLDTLHPVSDAELECLMEEKAIVRGIGQSVLTVPPSMT